MKYYHIYIITEYYVPYQCHYHSCPNKFLFFHLRTSVYLLFTIHLYDLLIINLLKRNNYKAL